MPQMSYVKFLNMESADEMDYQCLGKQRNILLWLFKVSLRKDHAKYIIAWQDW